MTEEQKFEAAVAMVCDGVRRMHDEPNYTERRKICRQLAEQFVGVMNFGEPRNP